jgi:hypothetical protein
VKSFEIAAPAKMVLRTTCKFRKSKPSREMHAAVRIPCVSNDFIQNYAGNNQTSYKNTTLHIFATLAKAMSNTGTMGLKRAGGHAYWNPSV